MVNTHEEADVILVNLAVNLAKSGATFVNILSDDTDVFILLVHFYHQEKLSCEMIMSATSCGRAAVDIKATTQKHKDIADQLLSAHAISGCDTVSQLFGIGKASVIKVVKANNIKLDGLGIFSIPFENIVKQATSFVASCYNYNRPHDNMSDVRIGVWTVKVGNKKITSAPPLKNLPPTAEAFRLHVLRAHYQAAIWRSALQSQPEFPSPEHYGWTLDDESNAYDPIPVPESHPLAPNDVLQLIKCGCASDQPCGSMRCGCFAANMQCTIFCKCKGSTDCKNSRNSCSDEEYEDDHMI